MGKLKIAIIGCGSIANTKHMQNLSKFADRAEMVAFCDIDRAKAEKACKEFGVPGSKVYEDYHELLKLDLDAVHVCTPNRSHAEITVAALEAGKNVMCEKPMAINTTDAKKMLDTQQKTGKLLTVGYQNRFRLDTMTLKKMAEEDQLGEIYVAKAHALRRRGIPNWGVFTNKFEQGGGPIIDIATHSLDMTLWIMDNYKPVSVMGATFDKLGTTLRGEEQGTDEHWDPDAYEVEDAGYGFVKFENGALVFIETSWALNTTDQKQAMSTVYGTKAGVEMKFNQSDLSVVTTDRVLEVNQTTAGRLSIERIPVEDPNDANTNDLIFTYPGATAECKAWLDALEGKAELVVKPEQAYVVTQILDAVYESAKTGKLVELK